MRKLQDSVALALPHPQEIRSLEDEIAKARIGRVGVRIIVGIGETGGRLPLRVLGYAKAIADTIRVDVRTLVNSHSRHLHLFSSATKLAYLSGIDDITAAGRRAVPSLVVLAESLRIAGCAAPISLELSAPCDEVPPDVDQRVAIPENLRNQLQLFKEKNNSNADCFIYAKEHAAMFEDLGCEQKQPLRIFIGGKAEGIFWAIRRRVRVAAASCNCRVNPMLGLVMFGLKRPWYHALEEEPTFEDFAVQSSELIKTNLERLSRTHHQLKRENGLAVKCLADESVRRLAHATSTFAGSLNLAYERGFQIGNRIQQLIS